MKDRVEYYGCLFGLCLVALMMAVTVTMTTALGAAMIGFVFGLTFFLSYRLGRIIDADRTYWYVNHLPEVFNNLSIHHRHIVHRLTRQREQWHARLILGLPVRAHREREHMFRVLGLIVHQDDDRLLLPDWFFEIKGGE